MRSAPCFAPRRIAFIDQPSRGAVISIPSGSCAYSHRSAVTLLAELKAAAPEESGVCARVAAEAARKARRVILGRLFIPSENPHLLISTCDYGCASFIIGLAGEGHQKHISEGEDWNQHCQTQAKVICRESHKRRQNGAPN